MRAAASRSDWARVDRMLEEANVQFAGNAWLGAMLAAMQSTARGRERERMMKESMYSSSRLRSRLVAKNESAGSATAQEQIDLPAYLRRKASQGKGDM